MALHVLNLPGLYNSGPAHWQSHWEVRYPDIERVNQADWATPKLSDWIATLEARVAALGTDVVLIGHSSSCALIAAWAAKHPRPIKGALLVAPSDSEAAAYPKGPVGFAPMPLNQLPFRSIVVTAVDDIYVSLARATQFADAWGSELLITVDSGHLGSDSQLGLWPFGLRQLARLTGDERFILAA